MTKTALKICIFSMQVLGLRFPQFKTKTVKSEASSLRHSKNQPIFKRFSESCKKKLIETLNSLWFIVMQTVYIIVTVLAIVDIPYLLTYGRTFEVALAIWLSFSVIVYVCLSLFIYSKQRTLRKLEKRMKCLVNTIHPYDKLVFSKSNTALLILTITVHSVSQFGSYHDLSKSCLESVDDAHSNTAYRALLLLEFFSSYLLSIIEMFHTITMICACFFEATEARIRLELNYLESNRIDSNKQQNRTHRRFLHQDFWNIKCDAFLLDECHHLVTSLFMLPLTLVNVTLLTTMSVGIYVSLDFMLSSENPSAALLPLSEPVWALLFLLIIHYTADAFRIKVSIYWCIILCETKINLMHNNYKTMLLILSYWNLD